MTDPTEMPEEEEVAAALEVLERQLRALGGGMLISKGDAGFLSVVADGVDGEHLAILLKVLTGAELIGHVDRLPKTLN